MKLKKYQNKKIKTKNSLVSLYRPCKMIARKGIYAIVTTLTYLVLIILYFELPSDTFALKDEDKKCNKNSPCVRFCLTHLKNRTNSWLFAQFNESFLSDAPYDGFNNTIDLENSDDETKVEETTTQKPKKGEEKKDPQDVIYGDRDYYYDDFGRKQKMKGKTKTKREIEDFDDFDNYDDDLSVRERRETKEIETTTLEFNDSTTLESNSSEEMKQENIVMKIRKIKIYRLPPSCIDSDSNQFHPLTDMKYDLVTFFIFLFVFFFKFFFFLMKFDNRQQVVNFIMYHHLEFHTMPMNIVYKKLFRIHIALERH